MQTCQIPNSLEDKIYEYGTRFSYAKVSSIERYVSDLRPDASIGTNFSSDGSRSCRHAIAPTLFVTLLFMKTDGDRRTDNPLP